MNVYVIRHGEYELADPQQSLSAKGAADMHRAAVFLKERGVFVKEIWHSPKRRAFESAQILQTLLGVPLLCEQEGLNPEAPPQPMIEAIAGSSDDKIVITHLPFIPRFLAQLFQGQTFDASMFPTSSIAVLEKNNEGWMLVEIFQ